jgi:parallel beta helix pectate lyase-like protein/invasin-like protein/FG-GAP repeat protein
MRKHTRLDPQFRIVLLSSVVLGLVLASGVAAQGSNDTIIYNYSGQTLFGSRVSDAGDVNGDGWPDFMVGSPYHPAYPDPFNITRAGGVWVYSGMDGSLLYSFFGEESYLFLGSSVSGAGDVNKDGYADFIIGVPWDRYNGIRLGSARVYSGQTGSILYTLYGDAAYDYFGSSVSSAGDVDRDEFADFIVSGTKYVRIFSGRDGSPLYTFYCDLPGFFYDDAVSSIGDINLDGHSDMIVGGYRESDGKSYARVFSGKDGEILHTFYGDSASTMFRDGFGSALSSAGDVDGDGYPDIIVGAYNGMGYVKVFSGKDGTILHTFRGEDYNDFFGISVSGLGDVNKDGHDDVLVGANQETHDFIEGGTTRVFSGKDGTVLYTFYGDRLEMKLGRSVSGVGDVNRDGYPDLIIGAPGPYQPTAVGFARVCTIPFPDPDQSLVTVTPDVTTLNGLALITATPKFKDGSNIGPGWHVTLSTTLGTLVDSVQDNQDGTYTQYIRATELGTATITATAMGVPLNASATLTVFDPNDLGKVIGVDAWNGLHGYAGIQLAVKDIKAKSLEKIYITPGTYNETVLLSQTAGLLMEPASMEGTVILKGMRLVRCTDVILNRLDIDASGTHLCGIELLPGNDTEDILIQNCTVHDADAGRDGIRIGTLNQRVTVAGCLIERNGGDGIHLRGEGNGHVVSGCRIWSNVENGIHIERRQTGVMINLNSVNYNGTPGHPTRSYGIYRQRTNGTFDPTDVTLIGNEFLLNNGVFIEGQSDANVGNWDQIIDSTDDQAPWDL